MQSIERKGRVLINLYKDELDQLTDEVREKAAVFFQCIFCKKRLLNCDCNEHEFKTLDQKLSRQTWKDIYLLDCLRRDQFGNNDDYFGTYSISNKRWEKISVEVRRSKREARHRRKGIARVFATSFSHDKLKINDVGEWLKKHYPNHSFALKRVAVAWKEKPSQSATQERLRSIYERAFKKGEKAQHGVLKWIAWNWLCEIGGCIGKDGYGRPAQFFNGSCVYEQRLFFTPNPRRFRYVASDGFSRSTYVRSGKMQDDKSWSFKRGDVLIVADVFGYGISIECGVTKAASLVLPLVHQVCEMTVWIPRYNEVAHTDKESLSEVGAFCIRLKKSAKRGWADIVV